MSSLVKILIAVLVVISAVLFFVLRTSSPDGSSNEPVTEQTTEEIDLSGIWSGSLNAGGASRRLVFNIERAVDGSFTGTIDSIDQGVNDIPITNVRIVDSRIVIESAPISAIFEGSLDPNSKQIVGTWRQGPSAIPFMIERVDEAPKLNRPQEPTEPFPYQVESVSFSNAAAGVDLGGTLTIPEGAGPFPAAILISGSGPQDRDETIAAHKPFWILADYLSRNGIAVLRFDDRGVGESTGEFWEATARDHADDAWAAFQFLLTRQEIAANLIGYIGHSEGGLSAPMIAADHTEVAFVVLMAAPGLSGEEILFLQTELISRAAGVTADVIANTIELNGQIYEIIKSESDLGTAQARTFELIESLDDQFIASLGTTKEVMRDQLRPFFTPWFKFFLTYDPRPVLERISATPILAVNGNKDLQVPSEENLRAIDQALTNAGNGNFETVEFGNLNHLFQTSETGNIDEYAQIEETIAPVVLNKIARWIIEQTRSSQ